MLNKQIKPFSRNSTSYFYTYSEIPYCDILIALTLIYLLLTSNININMERKYGINIDLI